MSLQTNHEGLELASFALTKSVGGICVFFKACNKSTTRYTLSLRLTKSTNHHKTQSTERHI